jgi:hypothetical protein
MILTRFAQRVLTGRPTRSFEVVLGHRSDGRPGATIHPFLGTFFCLDDPDLTEELARALQTAADHMRGASK